jgi:hypothetical protein
VLDLFLNSIAAYGPLILGLALLLGAGGLPIPIGLLMLAAGGLARQGMLDWRVAIGVSLAGLVLGDTLSTPTRKLCPSFDAARKMSILGLEVEHAWTEAQVQDCLNN